VKSGRLSLAFAFLFTRELAYQNLNVGIFWGSSQGADVAHRYSGSFINRKIGGSILGSASLKYKLLLMASASNM